MIRLEVQEYCHACSDFEPDVEKPEKYYSGTAMSFFLGSEEVIMTDTVVRCKYRKRCENLKRYLARVEKEANHEQSESK